MSATDIIKTVGDLIPISDIVNNLFKRSERNEMTYEAQFEVLLVRCEARAELLQGAGVFLGAGAPGPQSLIRTFVNNDGERTTTWNVVLPAPTWTMVHEVSAARIMIFLRADFRELSQMMHSRSGWLWLKKEMRENKLKEYTWRYDSLATVLRDVYGIQ